MKGLLRKSLSYPELHNLKNLLETDGKYMYYSYTHDLDVQSLKTYDECRLLINSSGKNIWIPRRRSPTCSLFTQYHIHRLSCQYFVFVCCNSFINNTLPKHIWMVLQLHMIVICQSFPKKSIRNTLFLQQSSYGLLLYMAFASKYLKHLKSDPIILH